ncbi:MAG: hypothetical protein ABI946_01855 [Chthoniobacterales bacterium]
MSTAFAPVSLAEISERIRLAATTDGWSPGQQFSSSPASVQERNDFHAGRIQSALRRARLKTFVKKAKPFRRILRSQGAVNESLIEAAQALALQQQELREEMQKIREALWAYAARGARSGPEASR